MVLSSSIVAVVGMKREYARTMLRIGQARPNHVVVFSKNAKKSSEKTFPRTVKDKSLGIKDLLESRLLLSIILPINGRQVKLK